MNLTPLRELPCYRYNPVNTQQDVAKAKAAGKYNDRTPLSTELRQEVISLAESSLAKTKIARLLNIGEATVYRILATIKKVKEDDKRGLAD